MPVIKPSSRHERRLKSVHSEKTSGLGFTIQACLNNIRSVFPSLFLSFPPRLSSSSDRRAWETLLLMRGEIKALLQVGTLAGWASSPSLLYSTTQVHQFFLSLIQTPTQVVGMCWWVNRPHPCRIYPPRLEH